MTAGIVILVCGSRDASMREVEDQVTSTIHEARARQDGDYRRVVVLHGDARGADAHADQVARESGVNVIAMPAQWHRDGRRAGQRRNAEMMNVLRAMHCCGWKVQALAFPKGSSRGTRDMIRRLRQDLPGTTTVVELDP